MKKNGHNDFKTAFGKIPNYWFLIAGRVGACIAINKNIAIFKFHVINCQ